ncbi:MAG: PilZ domain-containing protein [Candidatus Omnitrophota bacterium]
MEKRRTYWRGKTNNKITCHISTKGDRDYAQGVIVLDISPAGLSLISDKDIPEGTQLKLKINFPSSYTDEENNVMTKVAHCHKVKDKFKVGCYYVRKS